jgi:ABC-type multidrug transport system fused ATPase/permease subunit
LKSRLPFINVFENLLFLYKQIWKGNKSYFAWTPVEIILNALSPLPLILFSKPIIDELFSQRRLERIAALVLIMLGILLTVKILSHICKSITDKKTDKIRNDLLLMIQEKSMKIPYHYLENPATLDCRQTAMEVLNPVGSGFMDFRVIIRNINEMVTNLLKIASLWTLMIQIDFFFILLIAVATIIHSYLTIHARKKEFEAWEQGLVTVSRKAGYLQKISGDNAYAKEVRIYGLSDWICDKIRNLALQAVKVVSKNIARYAGVEAASNTMTIILEGFSYAYIGWLVIFRGFTVGDFSMYTSAIYNFSQSIIGLSTNTISIYQTGVYLKEFKRYLELEEDLKIREEIDKKVPVVKVRGTAVPIRFDDVYFRYPGQEDYVLKGINIVIHPNQRLSIVGDNGAGKTTFVKLLLRLFEPSRGAILIGGKNIKDLDYREYIANFSVVFQDFKIFAFSVLENIVYNQADNADLNMVNRILNDCGLKESIDMLPKKLDTYVSKLFDETGVELSGGEQQKLALCSSIYRDAPIVILDEPTAMLSPAAEYEVYTNFDKLIGNKTAIYISHRMSSCRFSDSIAVFHQGRIIEYGTHQQLLGLNRHYAKMFNAQADYYKELNG